MKVNFLFIIKMITLFYICTVNARRIVRKNEEKQSYVVNYQHKNRILPVTVELDPELETEYVMNLSPERDNRSVSFYDFRKGLVAFKILDSNQCFIARLGLETLQNDQKTLDALKNQVISDSESLSEFQVDHEITATYLQSISDRKMSRFCDGYQLYMLKQLPEGVRSIRTKRNIATSDTRNDNFSQRSYSHDGNQGTTYVHHSHSYVSGQLGGNGNREVKTHQIQVRSEGVQPISTQTYNQQIRFSNFPVGNGLGSTHNTAFVQNHHWSSSNSSKQPNVKNETFHTTDYANRQTKQQTDLSLDLGVSSEFRNEAEKSEHYIDNQNNDESRISRDIIPSSSSSSSLYKSSLLCCQQKNVNVLPVAVEPEKQIFDSSHQLEKIHSQGIPVHQKSFIQSTAPLNNYPTSRALNINQPHTAGMPASGISSGVSTQLENQFKPGPQIRYPVPVGFQPGHFQINVQSGYLPQVGVHQWNSFPSRFQSGYISSFGGQATHFPSVGSQSEHHNQINTQQRYPTQVDNAPKRIHHIAIDAEGDPNSHLSHPFETNIKPRHASEVITELKRSATVDVQQNHSPQFDSPSGHQTQSVFQSGVELEKSAEAKASSEHFSQVNVQPKQFSQTGISLTYPSETGVHLRYPSQVRIQPRYPFHAGFQPRYPPEINVQPEHLQQATFQHRFSAQGEIGQENLQFQNSQPSEIGMQNPLQVEVQSETLPQTRMKLEPDSQTRIQSTSQLEAEVNMEYPSNVKVQSQQPFQPRYPPQAIVQPEYLSQSAVELTHPSEDGRVTNYERTNAGTSSNNAHQGAISQVQIRSRYVGNGSPLAHAESGIISGSTQSQTESNKKNAYPELNIAVETSGASQSQPQFNHQSDMGTKESFFSGTQVQVHGDRVSDATSVQSNGISNSQLHLKITGVHGKVNNTFQPHVSNSIRDINSTRQTQLQFQNNYNSENPHSLETQGGFSVMKDSERHAPIARSALNITPSANISSGNVSQSKLSHEQTSEQSRLLSLFSLPVIRNNQSTPNQPHSQNIPPEPFIDSQILFMRGHAAVPPTPSTMENDISAKSSIAQKTPPDLLETQDSSPHIPLTPSAVPVSRQIIPVMHSSIEPSENRISPQILPVRSSQLEERITVPKLSPHQRIDQPPFLPMFPQIPGQFVNIPAFPGSQFIPNFLTGYSGQTANQPRAFPVPPNPYGPQLPPIHVPYVPNNLNGLAFQSQVSVKPPQNLQGIDLSDQIHSRVTVSPFQPNYPQRTDTVESVNTNTFSQQLTIAQPGQQHFSFNQHFSGIPEESCCGILPNFRQRCCDEKRRFGGKILEPQCCTSSSLTNFGENQHASVVTKTCKGVQTNCHIVYKPAGRARICSTATVNTC